MSGIDFNNALTYVKENEPKIHFGLCAAATSISLIRNPFYTISGALTGAALTRIQLVGEDCSKQVKPDATRNDTLRVVTPTIASLLLMRTKLPLIRGSLALTTAALFANLLVRGRAGKTNLY
jgi:hypothetical protein